MEYIPGAPVNDEVKKANQNLPGMGGVFNVVNFHLYHYAGNNPVKYTDPDGRSSTFNEKIQAVGDWFKTNHKAIGTIGSGIAMMLGGNILKGAGVGGGTTLAVASGGTLAPLGVAGGAVVYSAGQALEVTGTLTVAAGLAMLSVGKSDGSQKNKAKPNQSAKDAKKFNNSGADEFAQKKGYKDAHNLKDAYVGDKGGSYDIYNNEKTGESFLIDKSGKSIIPIKES